MRMRWQVGRLGDVARHRSTFMEIEDTTRYRRCRVQTGAKGVVLRDVVAGSDIRTKRQQVCRTDDFLVAEIDAKVGGYGLVGGDLDGAIVSSHYFLYELNLERLLPRFLMWFSRTTKFHAQVVAQGSTNYAAVRPSHVLEYRIPLPALEEQQSIVACLSRVERLMNERRSAVDAMDTEAEDMLRSTFEKVIDGAPLRPMSEVAPLVRRSVEIDPDAVYTEIGVRSFYKGIFHRRSMSGSEYSWQKLFLIEKGDIIFSNLMAWEQAIGEAFDDDKGCVGNHRMLTCQPIPGIMVSGFINYFFKTQKGFAEIVKASPGTAARNKTLSPNLLSRILVPTPSFDKQLWFNDLQAKVREIRAIREKAARDADALLPAMLHEIFGAGEA